MNNCSKYENVCEKSVLSFNRRCMIINGMSIRKQLVYDQVKKKMTGYVDLGDGPQEQEGEASEALVFMLTGIDFECVVLPYSMHSMCWS